MMKNKKTTTYAILLIAATHAMGADFPGSDLSENNTSNISSAIAPANEMTDIESAIAQHMAARSCAGNSANSSSSSSSSAMMPNKDEYCALSTLIIDAYKPFVVTTQDDLELYKDVANDYFDRYQDSTLVVLAGPDNILNINCEHIPATLKKLSVVGNHVTAIGNGFLSCCRGLTQVDLSGLGNVTAMAYAY